jgi:hypothetical protein
MIRELVREWHLLELGVFFEQDPPPNGAGTFTRRPPEQWLYWLIESPRLLMPLMKVQEASSVCDLELPCTQVMIDVHACSPSSWKTDLWLPPKGLATLDSTSLQQVRDVAQLIIDYENDPARRPIIAALESYWRLNQELRLPHPLFLFAVFESVLTHDPAGGYDSLTHQIANKMVLLNKRFEHPLDYSCFDGQDELRIWKKLYAYRSRVAHGVSPDFRGNLRVLKDERNVRQFLVSAVKVLLRHALKEPDLVLDLQKC